MSRVLTAPVDDHSELRSRAQSIEVGSRLTLAAVAAAMAYVVATWGAQNRTALVVLIALSAVWAVVPLAVGSDRIVRSAHRETCFLAWSVGCVAMIGVLAALDGGANSPLSLLFFLPLAFAALSYPLPSVVVIGTFDVAAFVCVGVVAGSVSQPHLALFACVLAITALLCAWEAIDHDRQREALARVSRADPLTGCLNRRGFGERFDAELDSGTRSIGQFGLVVLDLDDFKTVNDVSGHAAGDELLCWAVDRAAEVLRPMDSLGRLGGDEFAVLVPGAGRPAAEEVASRLREALAERVLVSAGVASFPVDGARRDDLHRHADAELYAAKRGRAPGFSASQRDLTFASALARAVTLRMSVPDEQSSAVAHYSAVIGARLGFTSSEMATLRMASILHDVGKVSVPDRILRKAGPLTPDEFEHVKSHSVAGAEIVAQMGGLAPVAEWIRHSHEHVDGSGYPDGLRGQDIPLGSRVLLVADAFDAMTRHRFYGSVLPHDIALAELRMGADRQFDPRCVEALAAHMAEHPDDIGLPLGQGDWAGRRFNRPAPPVHA
jgi:diguanylate cyclase (GGDEF)-like protein